MHKHPRCEAHRGIRQSITHCLRPRGHHYEVARVSAHTVLSECFKHYAFLVQESRRRARAIEESGGYLGRYRCREVEVDAEQSWQRLARHLAGDGGTPVATLRDVAGVA